MDSVNILIHAILEKSSKAHLEHELRGIEKRLKPIEVKTNIDKASRSYKTLEDGSRKLVQHSRNFTNSLGEQVSVTRTLNVETGKFTTTQVKKLTQEKKITDQIHRQSAAQKDMLTTIRGMRTKDQEFITPENLKRIEGLETTVRNLDPASKNFGNRMREVKSEFKSINTDVGIYKKRIQDANKHTNIWGQSLFEAAKKFAGWLFMGNIIMGIIRQARFAVSTIFELDKAMVSLRKVTDETDQSYSSFSSSAGELAVSLGKVRQEVINSATEFARLGFNVSESLILSKEAMLLSNVGLMDISASTKALISITKGFGVVIDENGRNVRNIVDIVNEVGNNFAISQEGIAEALERSAASMAVAGNTIEETVAVLTAANAVVQDPAKVGKYSCPLAA